MTAAPGSITVLLVQLARRGIELRAAGDRLRYRPRSAMTPDLVARLAAHKVELLAVLAAADARTDPNPEPATAVPAATYTPEERRLLAGCPSRVLELVEIAKRVFVGGVTVKDVQPIKKALRYSPARLIPDCATKHGRMSLDGQHET